MPYTSLKDINPALKGIKPKITLVQANAMAKWADAMEKTGDGPESPWAAAIAQFKKLYQVQGGKWVKRKQKESDTGYRAYTTSTNNVLISVNAIDVNGEAVPIAELVAAYKEREENDADLGEAAQMDDKLEASIEMTEAVSGSLEDYASRVKDAFRAAFGRRSSDGHIDSPYTRDVFVDDPDLGTSVVVCDGGTMYAVEYEEGEDGFTFADRGRWEGVVLTYKKIGTAQEMEEAQFSENATFDIFMPEGDHSATILEVVKEAGVEPGEGRRAPVVVDLQIIRPGPGNKKDNHYYPPETLKNYGHVFENADIFVTDHKADERSEKTKVGRIRKCPSRFTEEGAVVGRTIVYDPGMAEKIRNRADSDELHTLHCSILGTGDVQPGEVYGKKYGIVKSINPNPLVEFVGKAGAGGHAVSLAESNTGGVKIMDKEQIEKLLSESDLPQDVQERLAGGEYENEETVKEAILKEKEQAQEKEAPQKLAEAEVEKLVGATKLPAAFKDALKAVEYDDGDAVQAAIAEATEEVKKLTGSGKPFAQGDSRPVQDEPLSERDKTVRFNEIMDRAGGRKVPVPAEQ